jgi:hypothetical protein
VRLTHNTVVLRCGAGRMYNEACLVHGDLSEYNILYYESEVFFIDVSQSVEHDHPASFDFLRECSLSCLSWGCLLEQAVHTPLLLLFVSLTCFHHLPPPA